MAKGSCLCGNVKYEYSGDPTMKALCHCLTCRKISGGTNTVCLLVPDANFKITSPTQPKSVTTTHEVGMEIELFFCGDCGSALYKEGRTEAFQGLKIVLAGTLDDGDALEMAKPGGELWVKYRASWLDEIKGAGQMQGFE